MIERFSLTQPSAAFHLPFPGLHVLAAVLMVVVVVPVVLLLLLLVVVTLLLLLLLLLLLAALVGADEIGLVGCHDDGDVGHVPGPVDLVPEGLDVLEGGRAAHVVHQEVRGRRTETVESEERN